jgi:uncharacterized surface protein with fasciclin (FAS1) repeats
MVRIKSNLYWLFLFIILFVSCNKEKDQYYERPDWLKGNAWEVLSSKSHFAIFLSAIEMAGFKDLVNGKGIITVIAPTDDAFNSYLQSKGYSNINQIPMEELKKLVGYHLVYYSFNKEQFANYQPNGMDNWNPAEAGLYYKHRTKSRDSISNVAGTINVFHKERFLPVFSSYIFSTKGISPKSNYEYFYTGSTWTGDNGGFNISNASVSEYAIVSDNGYVHVVDKVIEPLETVYTELKKEPDYSLFTSLYDRFGYYVYDESLSKQYGGIGQSLYLHKFFSLPEIASEWSYNGEDGLPDYANLAELSSKAFNVFAPDNDALNSFFNDYWSSYYNNIGEIDFLPIAYLLYNHVYQGSIVFPEEITKETIKSSFGNSIVFDPNTEVDSKKICANGAFYGLRNVIKPPMFESITGPLFKNPKYKIFVYMMSMAGMVQPLMSNAIENTLFIPTDSVILNTIVGESNIFWYEGNPNVPGDEQIQVENAEGIKVAMSAKAISQFVNNHIVTEEITSISGKKIFRTRNPFSYIYVTDTGVASSNTYNIPRFANATEITGPWTNGRSYEVDAALIREEGRFKYLIASATLPTSPLQNYSEFSKLLAQAGLIDKNSELSFLFGDNFVLFVPTNQAILDAIGAGLIPTDKSELANYLMYYFVPVSVNSLNDYPFIGSGVQGDLSTSQKVNTVTSKLTLTDNGSKLVVSNKNGVSVSVISDFPQIYYDGAIYQIDNVLKSE